MCSFVPSGPLELVVNVVGVELSSQSTEIDQSASEPGSVNEPRLNACDSPSLEDWFAAGVTVGATFAIWTICTVSEAASLPPSESVTLMPRVVVFGPSGKLHWKLPPVEVVVGVPTSVPLAPHFG